MTKKEKKRLYDIEYRRKNKEKRRKQHAEWVRKNPEKVKASKDRHKSKKKETDKLYVENNKDKVNLIKKKWAENNKDKVRKAKNDYMTKRLLEDPLFKIKHNISCSIRRGFKNNGFKKKNKTENILGCSIESFKKYIESKWEPWMNWDNYGLYNGEERYGWDLDHIKAISSAINESDVIELNHFSNFQPLCSYINRDVKRDK